MSSMEQQLEDITECPICSDSFTDPRSLPCIHTFCLKCLEQYGRDKESGTKMACPTCRTEFTIPESGMNGLPNNFFIGKMQQIKKLSNAEQADACEVCDAKKKKDDPNKSAVAVKFCVECHEKLCISCSDDHLGHKMLRGHQLIDIDKVRGHESAEVFRTTIATCLKHKDQAMTVFCNDCKTPICVVCYISSHKQHDCSDINDVIDKFRRQMTTDICGLDDGVGKLHLMLESIEQQKQNFIQHVAAARYSIIKRAEELKQQVESNKKVLLSELSIREQEVSKKLDSLSYEIKQHASFVEGLMKYTKELSTKGAVCDIAQEASALHDRVKELLKTDAIDKSRNNMNTIDVKYKKTAAVCSLSNLIGCVDIQVKAKPGPQTTAPTLAKTLQARINNVGLCMTSFNDQLFITCRVSFEDRSTYGRGQEAIEVYDTAAFKLQKRISVPGLQQARGLTSCAVNNCLYASDPSSCIVFRVDLSGKITSWRVGSKPAGLSVNIVNNVLVAFPDDNCVREYTAQGSLIREIVLPRKSIASTNHVVQLTNGQFVVSYSGGVCTVNANGQIVCQYLNRNSDPVRLIKPVGLALVENGCILVADRANKQIVVINSSLTSARVLALPANVELKSPGALHFNEPRGRLYIGECVDNNQGMYNDADSTGRTKFKEKKMRTDVEYGIVKAVVSQSLNMESPLGTMSSDRITCTKKPGGLPLNEQIRSTGQILIFDNVFNVGNGLV